MSLQPPLLLLEGFFLFVLIKGFLTSLLDFVFSSGLIFIFVVVSFLDETLFSLSNNGSSGIPLLALGKNDDFILSCNNFLFN